MGKGEKTEIKYLCNQCWNLVDKPKHHYIQVGDGKFTTIHYSGFSETTEGKKNIDTGKIFCPKCKIIGSFKKAIVPKGERKRINKLLNQTADLSNVGTEFRQANLEKKFSILRDNGVKLEDRFYNKG